MFKPAADPGRPGIEAVFQWAREACQELHDKEVARLLELDKLVPEGFRSVLLGEKSRQVALNIYRAEGELTQDVFAPYKNTLAWPKTEEETRNYFSRTLCRETVEAYLAVGELIAKDLL